MLSGVFVTGTDTGVGKTVVSAALVARFGPRLTAAGRQLRYWKPIQTGVEQDDDTSEVGRLSRCDPRVLWPRGIRLPRPLSPHLSARLSGQPIVLDDLMAMPSGEPASTCWIIEGAGGVLVPLNATHLMAHLMVRLCLPILIVARSTLGTINHTLLTLEALRARSLDVAGVVMVGERNPANREAIEHYGRVAVVGELPTLNPLTPDALHAWAVTSPDPGDRLFHRCFT